MLFRSNYEIECDPASDVSERVLFPYSPAETNGIEDARFVRFVEDDGGFQKPMDYWIGAMAFTPDGKTLITGSRDKTIKLFEMPTVVEKKALTGHAGWVRSLIVSPDGKVLVSAGDDNTIKFWDLATGRNFRTVKSHTAGVRCVAFSPDGKRLASASWDRTIKLWEGGPQADV